MAFNAFIRRASSSLVLRRPYQREIFAPNVGKSSRGGVVGGQFPPFVRFLTGSAEKTSEKSPSLGKAPPPKKASCDDGLGFAVKNGPQKGTLTLIKKGQDEIIRIDVTPYYNVMDYYDAEYLECYSDPKYRQDQHNIDTEKMNNPEQVVDVNPCLHLKVQIFHGHMYNNFIMFDVIALADCPHKILIRHMSASVLNSKGEKFEQPHLEGFEDFLESRGIDPKSLKFFFDSLDKPRQFGNG